MVLVCTGHLTHYHPSKLHLVDIQNGNFLFRGGSPLTEDLNRFDYHAIVKTMKEKTRERGIELPDSFVITDITLLNPNVTHDKKCIDIEEKFFIDNPDLGTVVQYPIIGNQIQPYDTQNITKRQILAKTLDSWTHDKLPHFIKYLKKMLMTQNHNNVIFVHCMQGVDRTGEVIGAYLMDVFDYSLQHVVWQDTKYNNGKMAPKINNLNSLMWYADYLKYR
jgi:hypothetical protein